MCPYYEHCRTCSDPCCTCKQCPRINTLSWAGRQRSGLRRSNSSSGASDSGDGRYSYNQDRYDVVPNFFDGIASGCEESLFCGLYDGHGGLPFTESRSGGAIAQFVRDRLRPNILSAVKLFGTVNSSTVRCSLERAFAVTSRELRAYLGEHSLADKSPGGTTAVIAVLFDQTLVTAFIGDSQIFLGAYSENDLTYIPVSRKHHWCWRDEEERVKRRGGRLQQIMGTEYLIAPNGQSCINMTRSLGDYEFEEAGLLHTPETALHTLSPWREFVLVLCSDGVTDVMGPEEVVQFLGEYYKRYIEVPDSDSERRQAITTEATRSLTEKAKEMWAELGYKPDTDNITAIVVFLAHTPLSPGYTGDPSPPSSAAATPVATPARSPPRSPPSESEARTPMAPPEALVASISPFLPPPILPGPEDEPLTVPDTRPHGGSSPEERAS
eukprot:gnl/Trimastix_PCT/2974.p1 GENE.gnl/Trimastix_PCT/2974~~gnl/Trimastix_PCT/2974.p1  ORF type:complete len:451 (-),score=69.97 gnl/Trimastix_PCT/2974:113-1429(-)